MDVDILIDLVDLYKKLDTSRKENGTVELSEGEVIILHDHLKTFFELLSVS